jgi:hypothetical protein
MLHAALLRALCDAPAAAAATSARALLWRWPQGTAALARPRDAAPAAAARRARCSQPTRLTPCSAGRDFARARRTAQRYSATAARATRACPRACQHRSRAGGHAAATANAMLQLPQRVGSGARRLLVQCAHSRAVLRTASAEAVVPMHRRLALFGTRDKTVCAACPYRNNACAVSARNRASSAARSHRAAAGAEVASASSSPNLLRMVLISLAVSPAASPASLAASSSVLLQSLGSCGTAGSAASRACALAASTTHSSAAGRGHGQRERSSAPADAACARTTPEVLLRSAQRGRRHRAREPAHGRLRQRGERRSRLARLRATVGRCVFRRGA